MQLLLTLIISSLGMAVLADFDLESLMLIINNAKKFLRKRSSEDNYLTIQFRIYIFLELPKSIEDINRHFDDFSPRNLRKIVKQLVKNKLLTEYWESDLWILARSSNQTDFSDKSPEK